MSTSGDSLTGPVIDAHMHVGRWNHPDFLGREVSLADTLEVIDSTGMAGAAMCPTDRCEHGALIDDAKAALAAGSSAKLWVLPWMRPAQTETDLAFVSERRRDVAGMKIHPSLTRLPITDAAFAPFLELADREGLVVLVHCGRWQEVASYRFAIEAAGRHPGARFLLAHGGGDTPPLATAAAELLLDKKLDNVWFEFSGLREYWVIERNVKTLGAGRYLMGSDYGLAHPSMYIGAVLGMNLPASDKEKILGRNALEVFGRPLEAA